MIIFYLVVQYKNGILLILFQLIIGVDHLLHNYLILIMPSVNIIEYSTS